MADTEREPIGSETPEADYLEQDRPDLDEGLDPEAPAGPVSADPMTANEADVLDQSRELPDEDDYPPA